HQVSQLRYRVGADAGAAQRLDPVARAALGEAAFGRGFVECVKSERPSDHWSVVIASSQEKPPVACAIEALQGSAAECPPAAGLVPGLAGIVEHERRLVERRCLC